MNSPMNDYSQKGTDNNNNRPPSTVTMTTTVPLSDGPPARSLSEPKEIVLDGNIPHLMEAEKSEEVERAAPAVPPSLNDSAIRKMMRQIGFRAGDEDLASDDDSSSSYWSEEDYGESEEFKGNDLVQQEAAPSVKKKKAKKKGKDKKKRKKEDDDPDVAIIRRDTKSLRMIRAASFLLLFLFCALALAATYRFTQNAEEDDFQRNYDQVATSVTEGFLLETRLKFQQARAAADSLGLLLQQHPRSYLDLALVAPLNQLVRAHRITSMATSVSFSPYIRTVAERALLEQAARDRQTLGTEGTSVESCFVCGSLDLIVVNASLQSSVPLPGYGPSAHSCGALEREAREGDWGGAATEPCHSIQRVAQEHCDCNSAPVATSVTREEKIMETIFRVNEHGVPETETADPPHHPIWVQSSASQDNSTSIILFNQVSLPVRASALSNLLDADGVPVLSKVYLSEAAIRGGVSGGAPGVLLYFPVYEDTGNRRVMGSLLSEFAWTNGYFSQQTSGNCRAESDLLTVVVENSCNQTHTYSIQQNCGKLMLLGEGDLHDRTFSSMMHTTTYEDFEDLVSLSAQLQTPAVTNDVGYCRYRFKVYPTEEFRDEYVTNKPLLYTVTAASVFAVILVLFAVYDCLVQRRHRRMMKSAKKSKAIVSSLFPKSVRGRLLNEAAANAKKEAEKEKELAQASEHQSNSRLNRKQSFRSLMEPSLMAPRIPPGMGGTLLDGSPPIAELFDDATVMFLDIAGFTAWSSEREPAQVFTLLENIYQSFDEAAARLDVFKIETIGDSYVAVAGVPEARSDHAVVMARFAHECKKRFSKLTRSLEIRLGPTTSDLRVRIGLHSGSVTGGVLRGEKARFQLFGDTMNTSARMESTGVPGRIQVSTTTADLLIEAGKKHWLTARDEPVIAKGKGEMQTFFVDLSAKRGRSEMGGESDARSMTDDTCSVTSLNVGDLDALDASAQFGSSSMIDDKFSRLVEWNADVLFGLLQKVVGSRALSTSSHRPRPRRTDSQASISSLLYEEEGIAKGMTIMEEVADSIEMPKLSVRRRSFGSATAAAAAAVEARGVEAELDESVRVQLYEYVMRIASMYRDVPFHNFEHASHVVASTNKLIGRLLRSTSADGDKKLSMNEARDLHQSTYGISSDPLMHFTMVFSAMIHDVDHPGLPNDQLEKMKTPASVIYKGRSISEQNSLEMAWRVLMDEDFERLRSCIYTDKFEFMRFRQLLVNSIMATDIVDADLRAWRAERWEAAFVADAGSSSGSSSSPPNTPIDQNRSNHRSNHGADQAIMELRATVVFETIIQASDVAHTMQHWQTFTKFNERLFVERYCAFYEGNAEVDPTDVWYQGELDFFDKYVIPLAERLKACGVFGITASSTSGGCVANELVNWAKQNRDEWERMGEAVVQRMQQVAVNKAQRRLARRSLRKSQSELDPLEDDMF